MGIEVAFFGMGRVGLALSRFFLERGVPVGPVYSRSEASRERARLLLPGVEVVDDVSALSGARLLFVTVSDGAIAGVARMLRAFLPDAVIVHTSGAHPSSLIPGEGRASCHILQSIARPEDASELVESSLFTVEGDERGLSLLLPLLEELGLRYVVIEEEAKPLYHAAAVVASNYLVTLMHQALSVLSASGFPLDLGLEGLVALARGTLSNIEAKGVKNALTGPIARGDWDTVRLHVEKLRDFPELEAFYRFMADLTCRIAGRRLPPDLRGDDVSRP